MRENKSKYLPTNLIVIALLVVGAYYLLSDTLSTYPAYIHAWTQSDRIALAMNFQENGFDLFHPATYSLLTKEGITQVDFPIHDYLVAIISQFFDLEIVSTFRVYTMIYSLIGLFFFFKLCLLWLKSPIRSIFATIFLFTIPFYVYYQNGFLPSATAFSNFLIACFFILKAQQNEKRKYFIIAVVFLTLAALSRSPFFVFLFALLIQQLWLLVFQNKKNLFNLLGTAIGIVVFAAYYSYNQFLGKEYGSMFLSEFLYFQNFQDFKQTLAIAADRWGNELLSPFHAIVLLGLLIAGIYQYFRNGVSKSNTVSMLAYFLISSIGVLLFFIAFGKQFADHDYYYLDTFLPLLSLLVPLLMVRIKISKEWYTTVATVSGIFFFYFFTYAKSIQEKRYTPPFDDRIEYAYTTYLNAKEDLKNWGVEKGDTLYVLEAHSTNMPFTVWQNKGFTNLNSSPKIIDKELERDFTYAVLVDSFFVKGAFNDYPGLISKLKRVNGNGELSLYQKSKSGLAADFFENLIYHGYSNFDDQDNIADSVTIWTPEEVLTDSMGKSLKIQNINEYTFTVKNKLSNIVPNRPIKVHLLADYFQTDTAKMNLVCSINNFYKSIYTISQFEKTNEWMHHQFNFKIPPSYFKEGDELILYFWNPDKDELFVDNVNLLIYQ